jgi:hypothetical protein
MGIDTDARLFFGYEIDWDDLQKIQKELAASQPEEDLMDKLWTEEENAFNKEFPDLYLGYASPYYNCDCVDLYFYIGILPTTGTEYTIEAR